MQLNRLQNRETFTQVIQLYSKNFLEISMLILCPHYVEKRLKDLRKKLSEAKKFDKVKLRRIIIGKNQIPKRLTSLQEIWKYYTGRSTLHGIRYWGDDELYKFERVAWMIAVMVGLFWAITIVFTFYQEYQVFFRVFLIVRFL